MNSQSNITLQKKWIIIPLVFLYLLIVFISAWLCDDAYITFRTVDNFINGYGLTWNISERVQAYTHPLWMFFLSAFYFFTNEIYYTSITISIIISCITVFLLLYKLSNSVLNSIVTGLILILSKSFIDYSTSGLENPLSHLLIVIFFITYFYKIKDDKKTFFLSFITALAMLNRSDYFLIFTPALLVNIFNGNKVKNILFTFAGFIPFIFWEVFSLFYYGFLIPNTAFAKLNTGISQIELIKQGCNYFLNSLYLDPLTLFAIATSITIVLYKKEYRFLPLIIGSVLYLLYIVIIGGDFMSGRFFSGLLLCSVIIISMIEINFNKAILSIPIIFLLTLFTPNPNYLNNSSYGFGPKIVSSFNVGSKIFITNHNGIVDERFNYYYATGLLRNIYEKNLYNHPWIKTGISNKNNKINFFTKAQIGFIGFYSGSSVYVMDPYALSDPLLSKLPATEYWLVGRKVPKDQRFWNIGHFTRKIPDGYIETIKRGENKIENESLKRYYNKLSFVIKGDLFDSERWIEIINLNLGKYDYLIKDYEKKLLK